MSTKTSDDTDSAVPGSKGTPLLDAGRTQRPWSGFTQAAAGRWGWSEQ